MITVRGNFSGGIEQGLDCAAYSFWGGNEGGWASFKTCDGVSVTIELGSDRLSEQIYCIKWNTIELNGDMEAWYITDCDDESAPETTCYKIRFSGGKKGGDFKYVPCGSEPGSTQSMSLAPGQTVTLCVLNQSPSYNGTVTAQIIGPC